MAKITEITDYHILFSDGSVIDYAHCPDCCERNFADFQQLDDIARKTDFDTENMVFEYVEESGFRFGNKGNMFFVPCYSDQNGYYSCDLDIFFNGNPVLEIECPIFDGDYY